jgi:hypothetical protein
MQSPREEIPDLPKRSASYEAHADQIDHIRHLFRGQNNLVWRTIEESNRRRGGRSAVNLPSPKAADKEEHINCQALQILFHTLGMEVFRRDRNEAEASDLRDPLRHIASVRLSLMQYETQRKVIPLVPVIRELDEQVPLLAPTAEVPSLTPYLFKPQTAISQLRVLAGSQKFKDPQLLMNLGSLYPDDHHVLHSVCLVLVGNGMGEEVSTVLENRAAQLFGDTRALGVFLAQHSDLFPVFITALVETGKTGEAERWCRQSVFSKLLVTDAKVAEKYVTALRHQGKFEEAMRFMEKLRDEHGMRTRELEIQYHMARTRDRSLLKSAAGKA